MLDASNITRRLWVGAKPPFDVDLPGFDVLVLCAQELQPSHVGFHGRVVRAPLPDAVLSSGELSAAIIAARAVARALVDGQRVLVTCQLGLNRSALVASLGLSMVTRLSPDEIVSLMRARRSPNALFNKHFVELIKRLAPQGSAASRGFRS